MARIVTLVLSLALFAAAQGSDSGFSFRRVWSGLTTTATAEDLPNRGQAMHLIHAIFPAAAAPVSGLQIRIEASYDGVKWFPIAPDMTSAPRLDGLTYNVMVAYGAFPFVRLRSLTAPPSPLTLWYSGQPRPVVSYVFEDTDRFLL
jgi:hypothetical protein